MQHKVRVVAVRGSVSVDFVYKDRLYNLLITPLSSGYVDWQVSQDYEPLYCREGLQVPYFPRLVEGLISEFTSLLEVGQLPGNASSGA